MEENVRPVAPAPAPTGPGAAKRGGWIPLAVAAAGILAFVWLASLLTPSVEPPPPGAAAATTVPDPTDPPTTGPPVGTTTPPPTLLQLVPGLQGGLTVIYADPDAPAIGSATWSRHLAAPTPSNPTGVRGWDLAAAFDRSGQDLAVLDSGYWPPTRRRETPSPERPWPPDPTGCWCSVRPSSPWPPLSLSSTRPPSTFPRGRR